MQNLETLVTSKIHGLKKDMDDWKNKVNQDFAELRKKSHKDNDSVQQILYKISKDVHNLNISLTKETDEFKEGFYRINSILNNQFMEIDDNANNLTKFIKKNTKLQSIMNQTMFGILNQSSKLTANITKLR